VWYFFSYLKPAKNDTYSWQVAYTPSFTGDRYAASPDPTHAKNFCSFSFLTHRPLLHLTKKYFKWDSFKKKCMRAKVERRGKNL